MRPFVVASQGQAMGSASRIDVKHWKGPAKRNGGPIFVDDTRWAEIVGSRVCVSSSSPAIQELCELGREEECAPALLEYDAHKLKNVIGNARGKSWFFEDSAPSSLCVLSSLDCQGRGMLVSGLWWVCRG